MAVLLSFSKAAELESEVLGYESLALVAAPGHHLAEREEIRTVDLKAETVLLSRADCSYRRTFERILSEANATPNNIHSFQSTETLKRCVINGAGMTILPKVAVAENLAAGNLTTLNWEEGELEIALHMIWYKERWRPPALDAFMAMTRKHLKHR